MRNWLAPTARVVLTAVLIYGIGVAVHLTWHHDNLVYGDATARLANCPHTETVNCDLVNTSAWSELFGVPIAAFAVPVYLLALLLVWGGRTRPRLASYAFCLGLLAAGVAAFLFYVSKTQIGFLCLWCMRLYAVNLALPLLAGVAGGRSPLAGVREASGDLVRWPGEMKFSAAIFAVLLVATLAGQHQYRARLEREAAAEYDRIMREGGPTVPAVPEGLGATGGETPAGDAPGGDATGGTAPDPHAPAAAPSGERSDRDPGPPATPGLGDLLFPAAIAAPAPPPPPAGGPYKFPAPLRRLSTGPKGMKAEAFDLQPRLGKGKAIALAFWHPGYARSEEALVDWMNFFSSAATGVEFYAVSGRRAEEKDEEIWERVAMLGLPAGIPVLVDDEFAVSKALDVADVPNLALFDPAGTLVASKIKNLTQTMVLPTGNQPAAALAQTLSTGATMPTVQRMFPYYPGAELNGHCAPPFALKKFNTQETFKFTGRSASGKPTILIFWSSTCTHCQVEIPQFAAWAKTHAATADIVSVTVIRKDRPGAPSHRQVTESYIRAQKIGWTVLEDPDGAVNDLYGVVSTPTTFFISPDGTVRSAWYYPHPTGFEAALDKELAGTKGGAACHPMPPARSARLDFTVMGADGRRVPLQSLVDKPAIVHFWATWCAPCIKELPALVRFGDALAKSGAGRLLLVSVEDEDAGPKIEKFRKDYQLDVPSWRAPKGGLADKVDLAYRVPRTYLTVPGGFVVGDRQGEQDWDDATFAERVRSRLGNPGTHATK